MKLEVGKCYRTRDGRKVGPMRDSGCCGDGVFHAKTGSCAYKGYYENGVERHGGGGNRDLIAEWTDAPESGSMPSSRP